MELMELSGISDLHYAQFRVLVRGNQVSPVAQGLQQDQKAGVRFTGSSECSISNGIHYITKHDRNESQAKGTQNEKR